jgi:hypothetical protein
MTRRGTKLLVVGQPEGPDDKLDAVASRVCTGDTFHVRRCSTPAELCSVVRRVAHQHGRIDILDLHDHGSSGSIRMGDDVLFRTNDEPSAPLANAEIARELTEYLTDTAQVRLLGCSTATFPEEQPLSTGLAGRLLLLKLWMELGDQRTIFGTNDMVRENQFLASGFEADRSMLFSASAALDFDPPDYPTRQKSRGLLMSPYKPLAR